MDIAFFNFRDALVVVSDVECVVVSVLEKHR